VLPGPGPAGSAAPRAVGGSATIRPLSFVLPFRCAYPDCPAANATPGQVPLGMGGLIREDEDATRQMPNMPVPES